MSDAPSKLEKEVSSRSSKGFIKKSIEFAFSTALAVGTTALSMATPAGLLGPIIGGSFAGGGIVGAAIKKKKSKQTWHEITTNALKTYSTLNTVLYPMIWLGDITYPVVASYGAKAAGTVGAVAAKSAYALTAYDAAFCVSSSTAHHLYENAFNPAGIGNSIRTEFMPSYKRTAVGFAPGLLLTANGITHLPIGDYAIPTFAANAAPYGVYNGVKPLEIPAQHAAGEKTQAEKGAEGKALHEAQHGMAPEQAQAAEQYLAQHPELLQQLQQQYARPAAQA